MTGEFIFNYFSTGASSLGICMADSSQCPSILILNGKGKWKEHGVLESGNLEFKLFFFTSILKYRQVTSLNPDCLIYKMRIIIHYK